MKIIEAPHPTLRTPSIKVADVTPTLEKFIKDLSGTLEQKRKPRGVGLSAPQVDAQPAVFVTYLSKDDNDEIPPVMRHFINPEIVEFSKDKTFGENMESPLLEGCLSIPHLYGPVPRYSWVTFEYQTIENGKLVAKKERFSDFSARVMQHELDHLKGILFTDYILQFELPLYDDSSGKLKEIDRKVAEKF